MLMAQLDIRHRISVPQALLLLLVMPTMLLLCFATPPFWISDEPAHFERADSISHGHILPTNGRGADGRPFAGGLVDAEVVTTFGLLLSPPPSAGFRATSFHTIRKAMALGQGGRQEIGSFSNTAIYPPLLYAPASLAMLVSRRLGTPLLVSFYAARIANIIFFGAMILFLMRRVPELSTFAVCCAAVPIVLFNTASMSADAVLMAFTVAFAILLSRLPNDGAEHLPIALGVTTVCVTVGKVAYLPLAILPCLVAAFADRRCSRRVLFLSATAFLSVALWMAWAFSVRHSVFSIRNDILIDPFGQLRWMAGHPTGFLKIFAQQIRVDARRLIVTSFGSNLAWDCVAAPGWLGVLSGCSVLMSANLGSPHSVRLQYVSLVLAVCAACAAAIFVLLYLQFNETGSPIISGLQGRYFLPLIVVGALWLPTPRRLAPAQRETLAIALAAGVVSLNCAYFVWQTSRWWTV